MSYPSRTRVVPVPVLALAAAMILASCSGDNLPPSDQADGGASNADSLPPESQIIRPENPIPGQYLFLLDPEQVPPPSVRAVADELIAPRGEILAIMDGSVLAFGAGDLDDESALAILADPRVLGVGQDGYVDIELLPPPDKAATQSNPTWGLDRIDQRTLPYDQAYRQNTTGAGVHAYVLDTGVNGNHADFAGRMGPGMTAILDGMDTIDCQGHGTHVAGTLGGASFGVAKDVTIHPVRVLGCDGRGSLGGIIAGLDWVTHHHVKPAVVNMSLGASVRNALLDQAVQATVDAGVVVVAAAGNSDVDACGVSPAGVPDILTVGATAQNDARAVFSNHGACVDIFAPGVAIESARWDDNNNSRLLNGTSMASPHVAGVVALYLESNPMATQADVNAALLAAATPDRVQDPKGAPNVLLYSYFTEPPPSPCQLDPNAPGCDTPATCADVLARDPGAQDGDYTLFIDGDADKPWPAYCHDMAGTPREYLSLPNGGGTNFGQYTAGGASPGSTVRTSFTRVRIDPTDMSIVIVDKTFATSSGVLSHAGNDTVTSMALGAAMSCDGSASGAAGVDLQGTPFAMASGFCTDGFNPVGSHSFSASNQVVTASGGGSCGWTAPSHPTCAGNPFNDNATGIKILLDYQPLPSSCLDIKTMNPAAPDGDYTLFMGREEGKPWMAYCHDMAGTARTYLTLISQGPDVNYAQYTAGGAAPGTSVRTSYQRVRIDTGRMAIVIADKTFATSTGSLVHGGQSVTSMPFGVAMSCNQSASGRAHVDLTGTPFEMAGGFCTAGWQPAGQVTSVSGDVVVDVTGGGYCGWTAPDERCPYNPFNSNAQNTVMRLDYVN